MRAALALVLSLVVVASAAAATVHGGPQADRIDAADGLRQSVSCGAGADLAMVDLLDRVASDCETVSRRISVDPTTDPQAQHATEVEPDSFAYGSTLVSAFQVGRFAGGGAVTIGFATTRDAGRTWRSGLLPGIGRSSDPSVAYDARHGVWLTVTLGITNGPTSIDVSRSPDGVAWSGPVHAALDTMPHYDKEWIACDNGAASPRIGTCYVAYADLATNRLATIASTDGGLTWSPGVDFSEVSPNLLGAQPVVEPDGTLVVLYVRPGAVVAQRSTDGGATFEPPVTVSSLQEADPAGFRAPPAPSAEADPTGRIAIAWQDCRFRAGCAANDIVASTSSDGATWSAPVRATRGGGTHFTPGLGLDPAGRRLAVVSYARTKAGIQAVLSTSTDGVAWTPEKQLVARPFVPASIARAGGAFLGDYVSTSWVGGRPIAIIPLAQAPIRGRMRESIYAATTK
ncbi:MAG: sialidase family protein [Gaiellaceae bacterium]